MTRHRIYIATALAACFLAGPVFAQTTVRAFVDKTTMGDGEVLLYTVEANGVFDDLDRIVPPETRGLVSLGSGPVQSWNISTINGIKRHALTLQWQYRPLGTGTAYIGATMLRLDGRDTSTDPIVVTVVDQAQRTAPPTWTTLPGGAPRREAADAAPDLFIRAEPSTTTAYVGEQVVIDYVLYFEAGVHPRNSRIVSAWDADGFWREDLELDRFVGSRTAEIDGRTFEAVPIKRLAVFPTRSGQLQVDSLDIEIDVLRSTRTRQRGLFSVPFGSRFDRETVTAPSVTVEVSPLPPGAPSSFAGTVGTFQLQAAPDRREVAVGEPVRVTATVSGSGNIATLEAPRWEATAQFEQYPVREAERINRNAARLRGEKTYTYTLVPRSGGDVALPPVTWSYFEPDVGAYRTLRSDSLRLRVVGPAAPLAEGAPPARTDRLPLPRTAAEWKEVQVRRPFYTSPWIWAGVGIPALAFLALVVAAHRRGGDEDTAYARSLRAFPAAERGLAEVAALSSSGAIRDAHTAVARTVHAFLADRLAVPTHGTSYSDLDTLLADRGVALETRSALLDLLRTSDAAQFAPLATDAPDTQRTATLMAAVDAEARAVEEAL